MTEYELTVIKAAAEKELALGVPGVPQVIRLAIAGSIILRLRHEFNFPAEKVKP